MDSYVQIRIPSCHVAHGKDMKAGCPGAHKVPGDKLTPNLEDEATQSYLEHVVDTSFILFLFLWIKTVSDASLTMKIFYKP